MKLTVNGVEIPVADNVRVRVEVALEGETIGPIDVEFIGGTLHVRSDDTAALTLHGEGVPFLALGDKMLEEFAVEAGYKCKQEKQ